MAFEAFAYVNVNSATAHCVRSSMIVLIVRLFGMTRVKVRLNQTGPKVMQTSPTKGSNESTLGCTCFLALQECFA